MDRKYSTHARDEKFAKKIYSNEEERRYHVKDLGDDTKTCLERHGMNPL
jgi:hypothetical protein